MAGSGRRPRHSEKGPASAPPGHSHAREAARQSTSASANATLEFAIRNGGASESFIATDPVSANTFRRGRRRVPTRTMGRGFGCIRPRLIQEDWRSGTGPRYEARHAEYNRAFWELDHGQSSVRVVWGGSQGPFCPGALTRHRPSSEHARSTGRRARDSSRRSPQAPSDTC